MRKRNRRIALLISLCMIIALIPLSTVSVLAAQRSDNPFGGLFVMDTTEPSGNPKPTESDNPSESPAPSESPEVTESATPSPSESVKPSPSEEPSKLDFTDVSTKDYFYEPVVWAVDRTITAGTDTTHFSPNAGCSRAQVMTFLWRANGAPKIILRSNPAKNTPDVGRHVMNFTDVKPDQYYYDPVCWAVKEGITAGTSETTFEPDASCTRAQVMTFLWQAYK